MADRIISPPLNQLASLRTPLTTGERRVLEFFNKYLSPAWEIYIQPHLNGLRPDFVLLRPRIGIAIFEIKDWNLDALAYTFELRESMPPKLVSCNRDGKQIRHKDNPVDKIVEYKQAILEVYCPRLRLRAIENPNFAAVVTAGIIMPKTTTVRAEQLLRPSRDHHGMLKRPNYYPVAGSDALAAGAIEKIFPESLRHSSYYMEPQFADDLRSWLIEPDFAANQRQPLTLNVRQRGLVRSRTELGFRRIKGAAGSGKSLVLAARAAQLSAEGRDVLVVTFNQTLWHYLRDLAVRSPVTNRRLNERVTWCHFHEWCKRVCQEAGLEDEYRALWRGHFHDSAAVTLEQVLHQDLPALVEKALSSDDNGVTMYDALLVDEGQDFNLDWWNLLRRAIRPSGEYILVADETQDLYDRTKYWTAESMIGAGFRGPWFPLAGNYRLPPDLIPLLRSFAATYLPEHNTDPPEVEQLALTLYPVRLRWIQVHASYAVETCVDSINEIHTSATDLLAFSDITFLADSHDFGLRCVNFLGAMGIECAHTFGQTAREQQKNKRAFFMGDARVKASTIHSFKGWETRAAVVHLGSARDKQALSTAYVALSRLKRHEKESLLTVVCSAPELESYGKTWPLFEKR